MELLGGGALRPSASQRRQSQTPTTRRLQLVVGLHLVVCGALDRRDCCHLGHYSWSAPPCVRTGKVVVLSDRVTKRREVDKRDTDRQG